MFPEVAQAVERRYSPDNPFRISGNERGALGAPDPNIEASGNPEAGTGAVRTLSTLAGAGAGAATGAAADKDHPVRGAIVGGLAGGTLGYAGGRMVEEPGTASVSERATALWKTGLLTSPTTHAANIAGNTTMAILETAKDGPAAVGDRLLSLATGRRTKSLDLMRTVKASIDGAKKGVAEAKLVMQGIPLDDALQKWDLPRETNFGNAFLDTYTKTVFRSLEAEDRIFRNIALQRSLQEQLALNDGVMTDNIALQAIHDAEVATFQDQGTLARAAAGLKRPLGVVGDIALPFVRTPANVATRMVEYSPLGYLKSAKDVIDLVKYTKAGASPKELLALQRAASETFGRATTGSLPILAGYILAKNGRMTGARPASKSDRDQWQLEGKQENAVLFGGKWRNVTRISPLGNLMALGANMYHMTHDPNLSGSEAAAATLGSIGTTVSEQSFLSGVQDINEAIRDPKDAAGRYVQNLAGSVVPAIVSRAARAVDPTVREAHSPAEEIQSRIPFASRGLPAKIDQFGHDATRQGGVREIVDPFSSQPDRRHGNPLIAELARVGATVGHISRWPGESVGDFQERQRLYGRALVGELTDLFNDPEYPLISPADQRAEIEDRVKRIRRSLTRELKAENK